MVNTADKILLSVMVLFFIGMSGLLVAAIGTDSVDESVVMEESQGSNEISIEEAKVIALEAVPGTLADFGIEEEHGLFFYEIEILKDGSEFEILIDPMTGNIVSVEMEEQEENEEGPEEEITQDDLDRIGGLITRQQAEQIALDYVGSGVITDFESEMENGRVIFEVKVRSITRQTVEIEIDAQLGIIIEIGYED